MAASTTTPQSPLGSSRTYDTALCLIPPKHLWAAVDNLRTIHDPAYKKWPPHINLVYPFVPAHNLLNASESILSQLRTLEWDPRLDIRLDAAGFFAGKKKATYFIHDEDPVRASKLVDLRKIILQSLGQDWDDSQMHMTIGQKTDISPPFHRHTLQKLQLLPALQWKLDSIYILVRDRDRTRIDHGLSSQMKVWGVIDLTSLALRTMQNPINLYTDDGTNIPMDNSQDAIPELRPLTHTPYSFSSTENRWVRQRQSHIDETTAQPQDSLSISSYNIQAESGYPPTRARYPIIIQNLLDSSAQADVLILEDVTDDFLSYLCRDERIYKSYQFISNGPPDQPDIEPLSDYSNVVVLSKWPFTWGPFSPTSSSRTSVIVQLSNFGRADGKRLIPTIISAVHLTPGLTNGSIEKKRQELQSILKHLSEAHPRNPWIVAGAFNIPTSVYSIETAIEGKQISRHSKDTLSALEAMLVEVGLADAWASTTIRNGDPSEPDQGQQDFSKALGGEQGATFDPISNYLANGTAHDGFDARPQRYDRILFRKGYFTATDFTVFGRNMGALQASIDMGTTDDSFPERQMSYGSDHWGIRSRFQFSVEGPIQLAGGNNAVRLEAKRTPYTLANTRRLAAYLSEQSVFPSDMDIATRESVLDLLKEVILQGEDNRTRGLPASVIVPVGSYGLGVWTASSDINCLCIGPISSKTFLALAIQRLRKASQRGVKILRRVDAYSDAKLELEVGHIRVDLQYCPAGSIIEKWPAVLSLPSTDPVFKLPPNILATLKPLRDLCYLRRTIPDLAAFRLSYHAVKCWARRRGIYGAQFGYLSGIQISILLSRVCKLLTLEGTPISAPTILTTFYHHYAGFDWEKAIVFDPFFHKRVSYVRTAREAMVILGFHGPRLNTAQTASVSTVHTISKELKFADEVLSKDDVSWPRFLGENTTAVDFLGTYTRYIKITTRFWGVPLAMVNNTLCWLESRCALFLADLGKVPGVHMRIWPARFVSQDASEEDKEYEGHYLIGLDIEKYHGQTMSKKEIEAELGPIRAALQKFEDRISGNPDFDPKSSWAGVEIISRAEATRLRLDDRDWSKHTAEAEDDDLGDSEFWASMEADERREQPTKKEGTTRLPDRPAYEGKLRSAGDVLNRLRWDRAMDSSDHIVGYEDRFSGVMERPVDSWKSETTHEEFIPEHRIMYFKRKSDGAIVWDKERRWDKIFGSGATSLGHH